jgi:hypothetical protein
VTDSAPANLDVFVLGTRSSGKSVLLASLYRQLSSMSGVTNFYARCDDPEQHRELCDNYDQLLDTQADWPTGSYRVDSYDMRCFHRLRGKNLEVFSIRFHDYPGGYVSNQIERRDYIDERAEQCTSVMALIDGRKLLDRLEDREVNPAHSLHRDLDSLVRVLQQCVGKPIHFVLTKSDLLPPAKFPLADMVAELKRHRGFSDILEQQIASGASCFLIPVSAIGANFAYIDPADSLIKKRRNGTIEPFHLDIMTSVSMVDTVLDLARIAATASPDAEEDNRPLAVRLKERLGKKLGYARMAAPATFPVFGPLGVLGIIGLTLVSEKYIEDKARIFEDKVREIRQGITDQASALEAILKIQYQVLERFVARFPIARLGARFDPAAWDGYVPKVSSGEVLEDTVGTKRDARSLWIPRMAVVATLATVGLFLFASISFNPVPKSAAVQAEPPQSEAKASKPSLARTPAAPFLSNTPVTSKVLPDEETASGKARAGESQLETYVAVSASQASCETFVGPNGIESAIYRVAVKVTAPLYFSGGASPKQPGWLVDDEVDCGSWTKSGSRSCTRDAGQPATTNMAFVFRARPNEDPKYGPRFGSDMQFYINYSSDPNIKGRDWKYYYYQERKSEREISIPCKMV